MAAKSRPVTNVRFYICAEPEWLDAAKFSVRLGRMLRRKGHRLLYWTPDVDHQTQLNELMWAYPADGFLPHRIDDNDPECGIDICAGTDWAGHHDVLINLTAQIPEPHARFAHLCEVVPGAATLLDNARDRWRHYNDRGHPLKRFETDNI
ncbi:hypothetical protein GH975_03580 [Litorivicinus lipolyticus]|uniref:DNA polymerase III subunit chi n=1 Tax=Litorivicinus lipolyticus TaxID=418701 RepID=A0A5Q2QCH6_9GAMM|nr:hypothetical protein GH975_03580 [Litorivicinus lipolyticus]